ncbi:MAG: sulfatase-like hydrolase/transferase, partial [Planctomycetota bacterium]
MSLTDAAVPLAPGPQRGGNFAALCLCLRQAPSVQEKLLALAAADEGGSDFLGEAQRQLASLPEKDVMLDDGLRLLKVWFLHRCARPAERDYYLHAFPGAEERRQIRRALEIEPACAAREAVVLLTVDCLRGDRLSCNGCPEPLTPNVEELAAGGINFPRAYATAGQTAQSFPGILLSNFFQNFGRSRAVPDTLTTLAEALSRAGYYSVAYNAANPHVSHFYGYDRGFDEFHDYLGPEN